MDRVPAHILPTIIFSQFAGTSLWFAGNAIVQDLQHEWSLADAAVGYVTIAVQLGFIVGTLIFAGLSLADRFSPRVLFFLCAIVGSGFNALLLVAPQSLWILLLLRFLTGFFLAGIYPVGMKIAASWYASGLGRALGYLVGALVVGTAFPHVLNGLNLNLDWRQVLSVVSALAVLGGSLVLLWVPGGPNLPPKSPFQTGVFGRIFRSAEFRASAFGYFGHMWELYAFWAFLPVWLLAYGQTNGLDMNVSFWTFAVIAAGAIGCVIGGLYSLKKGSARVAAVQLAISGACCALAPLFFELDWVFVLVFLLIWGITVVGDSPQFSTLNAHNAPREYVGSALTLVNSVGFLITIVSIQLINALLPIIGPQFIFLLLLPGPLFGLWSMRRLLKRPSQPTRA